MRVDIDEVRRIAALARIELGDAAAAGMAADLTTILTYVEQLAAVDTAASDPAADAAAAPRRSDTPRDPLDRDDVAANAPEWAEGFFVVPKVLGD